MQFSLQYFLKTGACKYGPTCKYHHPKDRNGAQPVMFNVIGLPMRLVISIVVAKFFFFSRMWKTYLNFFSRVRSHVHITCERELADSELLANSTILNLIMDILLHMECLAFLLQIYDMLVV
jgi:hypothetical protein